MNEELFPIISKEAARILQEELAKLEAELKADFEKVVFPHGRQAAWERLSRMVELSPNSIGTGPINTSKNDWWRNRSY